MLCTFYSVQLKTRTKWKPRQCTAKGLFFNMTILTLLKSNFIGYHRITSITWMIFQVIYHNLHWCLLYQWYIHEMLEEFSWPARRLLLPTVIWDSKSLNISTTIILFNLTIVELLSCKNGCRKYSLRCSGR